MKRFEDLSNPAEDSPLPGPSANYVPPRKKPDLPQAKDRLQRPQGLCVPTVPFGRRSLTETQLRDSLEGGLQLGAEPRSRPTGLALPGPMNSPYEPQFLDVNNMMPRPSSAVDMDSSAFLCAEDEELRSQDPLGSFGGFNESENSFERLHCSMHAGEIQSPFGSFREGGGFLDFQSRFPELCEGSAISMLSGNNDSGGGGVGGVIGPTRNNAMSQGFSRLSPRLSSLSQPCLPATSQGPTRILPFMYLGSQHDASDAQTLKKYGVRYVINMSISCPKPEFMQEGNFLRIPVNDSYQEKLLPYFEKAFTFLDKARESNECVLVHCLAGISRSPTLAIAYIMRHLHMNSDEAYAYVKAKRPSISPNLNFMGQLLEFEKLQKQRRGREAREQLKQSMRKVLVPLPKCARFDGVTTNTESSTPTSTTSESRAFTDAQRRRLGIPLQTDSDNESSTLRRQHTLTEAAPVTGCLAHHGSNWSLSDSPGAMRRSLSCPIKMHKSCSDQALNTRRPIDDISNVSPSHEPNANGKREMRPKSMDGQQIKGAVLTPPELKVSDQSQQGSMMAPPLAADPMSRALAFGKRGLNIPFVVKEDLPSPSTELSTKLSFAEAVANQQRSTPPNSANLQSAVNPFFAAPKLIRAQMREASCSSGEVTPTPQSTTLSMCAPLTAACSTSTTNSSQSPFNYNPSNQVVIQQPKSSIDQPISPMEVDTTPPASAENPMFQGHAGYFTAVTGNRGRSPATMRTGISQVVSTAPCNWSRPSTNQQPAMTQPIITIDSAPSTSGQIEVSPSIGLSRRIAQFIKRTASGVTGGSKPTSPTRHSERPSNFCAPKSMTVDHLSLHQQQLVSAGLPPPSKSKSESALLHSFSELDSPESGFVESPIDVTPTTAGQTAQAAYKDRDRESLGSTSSLEIAVNS